MLQTRVREATAKVFWLHRYMEGLTGFTRKDYVDERSG